jgi:hypothetical protein
MNCPFYGKHPSIETGVIMDDPSGGNRCALIVDSHAPCLMEILGYPVDATSCELLFTVSQLRRILARRGPA